jgi:hypothetical protein
MKLILSSPSSYVSSCVDFIKIQNQVELLLNLRPSSGYFLVSSYELDFRLLALKHWSEVTRGSGVRYFGSFKLFSGQEVSVFLKTTV